MLDSTKLILISCAFLFTSCRSTEIFFDINEQAIISCENNSINNLIIETDLSKTNFDEITCRHDLFWKDSLKEAPSKIYLKDIYKIYSIKNKIFSLPKGYYKITNDGSGDEGYSEIKIWVNNQGKVYKTDKSSCK